MAEKKKIVDTWKTKNWYTIVAPKMFKEAQLPPVAAQDEAHLLNRIIQLPLKEITHELTHLYTNVRLRVDNITGKSAYTKFIGHSVAREHLQTLGRRNRALLYCVFHSTSQDGIDFTTKVLVVTAGNASGEQRTALRNAAVANLKQKIESTEFAKFIQDVIYGKAASELQQVLRKIYPIKRVEIYKTELTEVFDVEKQEEIEMDTSQAPDTEETEETEEPAVA